MRLSFVLILGIFSIPSAQAIEVTFEEDHSLPMVYLNIATRGGSAYDQKETLGLTNFLGQMLTRGTRSRTKEQLSQALDQIGAKVGVETRSEMMILRCAVLAEKTDDLLKLLTEILSQPSFPPQEIEKLKNEIISTILQETSKDSTLTNRHFLRYLFGNHPYGFPISGTEVTVSKLNQTLLKKQYDLLFQDKNLIILGSGAVSGDTVVKWANELSVARPNTEKLLPPHIQEPQFPSGVRMAFVDKPFRTQVSIRIGHRGSLMSSSDHFALSFADSVFGGGSFNSKLMQEIRVKRGWSYGAYSSFKYGTQPRSWTLSMEVSNKDAPAALAYTLNMIKEFSSQGISAEEFAFGKNNIINSAGFSYNTPKKRSENKLLESIFKLPEGFMKWAAPQTERLTLEQVNAVIKRFFNPNELAVLTLGTASDSKQALVKAAAVEETNVSTIPYDKD